MVDRTNAREVWAAKLDAHEKWYGECAGVLIAKPENLTDPYMKRTHIIRKGRVRDMTEMVNGHRRGKKTWAWEPDESRWWYYTREQCLNAGTRTLSEAW